MTHRGARRLLVLAAMLGAAAVTLQAALELFPLLRPSGRNDLADVLYYCVMVSSAVFVLARAALIPRERLAWTLIGLGVGAWAAGDLYYQYVLANPNQYPSLADGLYLSLYILALAGLRLIAGRIVRRPVAFLGLVVALFGFATLWSWLVFSEVQETATGSTAAVATNLAYPLLDLFLVGFIVIAMAANGWRLDRPMLALAAGLVVICVADSIYAYQIAVGSYGDGALVNSLWPAGVLLIAIASWLGTQERRRSSLQWEGLAIGLAVGAMGVALGVLLWDHFSRLDLTTVLIAAVTLSLAIVQIVLLYHQRATAKTEAHAAEELQFATTAGALDCVVTVDRDNRIREWNETAARTFGHSREQALGRELAEMTVPPALRERHRQTFTELIAGGDHPILHGPRELTAIRADGTEFPIEVSVTKVQTDPPMFTGHLRDITDRKQREEQNDRLAAIVRSSEDAMLSTTLDGEVTAWNDGATHLYGYSEEQAIGSGLSKLIVPPSRAGEIERITRRVVTLGAQTLETRRHRKDGKLVDVALRSFPIKDHDGSVIGISAIAHDITDRQRKRAEKRLDLEGSLWRERIQSALDQDRLLFQAQPIVEIATGEVHHHELLLRMRLDGKLIPPGRFLPHAEDSELMAWIDRWAVVHGTAAARQSPVAINLSASSIGDFKLIDLIKRRLRGSGADPSRMTFEITETAAADNLEAAHYLVEELTSLGCGVSLDDFGTGYGSFTYLKHLPVTELKIDMEFIRDLSHTKADQRVVSSLVAVAQNFGIRTVAEGVEDAETYALLKTLGVDLAQGYLLGRPAELPPAHARELTTWRS